MDVEATRIQGSEQKDRVKLGGASEDSRDSSEELSKDS